MSAGTVSLRALVVEDIARTAAKCNRPAAAMLLRRFPCGDALNAVAADLAGALQREGRAAGTATAHLSDGSVRLAVERLARFCGLSVEEWTAESAREQGVEVQS